MADRATAISNVRRELDEVWPRGFGDMRTTTPTDRATRRVTPSRHRAVHKAGR